MVIPVWCGRNCPPQPEPGIVRFARYWRRPAIVRVWTLLKPQCSAGSRAGEVAKVALDCGVAEVNFFLRKARMTMDQAHASKPAHQADTKEFL